LDAQWKHFTNNWNRNRKHKLHCDHAGFRKFKEDFEAKEIHWAWTKYADDLLVEYYGYDDYDSNRLEQLFNDTDLCAEDAAIQMVCEIEPDEPFNPRNYAQKIEATN
jgi:hypothetical protein